MKKKVLIILLIVSLAAILFLTIKGPVLIRVEGSDARFGRLSADIVIKNPFRSRQLERKIFLILDEVKKANSEEEYRKIENKYFDENNSTNIFNLSRNLKYRDSIYRNYEVWDIIKKGNTIIYEIELGEEPRIYGYVIFSILSGKVMNFAILY